ncbi:glycoside hydrolase family 2 TIM barrel-domain containing protein [Steroidobacter flavus]|uniref:beta-galactosidase n=1 Tax=Steroidobacter flavus TaxID=1842136 RepID=A0ABV8SYF5_9GAMM
MKCARIGRFLWLSLLVVVTTGQAEPTKVLALSATGEDGEAPVYWDFRIDQGRGAGQWQRIPVPSNWEQQGFGTYLYGMQVRRKPDDDPAIPKERGEYRREFIVPGDWRNRQVRIVFEGAMTDTAVRINGQSAGPVHQGGFYRFEYDITSLIRFDQPNLLEVQVDKESTNASVNRAERRGDYWTFGGIYRPVWLEARPARHIEWLAVDARADGSLYAQVHLGGAPSESEHLEGRVIDAAGRAVSNWRRIDVPLHGPAILREQISKPLVWSAETPNLYRLQVRLDGGEGGHELETRFGFRTFEVRPRDGLYLNGRKIVLKGVNRHSFNPDTGRTLTRQNSVSDVRAMKAANMNAVRMSHYPPDPHFLEVADELGMYVLNELAGWQGAYDTPTGTRLIGQIVRRDVNHPSILFWDNGNEGGWNREVDGEFDRWDPQRRPVLHPWAIHSGINTDHYENYDSTVKLSAGPDIFMPTEFLHGLYDGGAGAGLYDYWKVMSSSPTVGGGFIWAWADEGVRRTDQGGRIDNRDDFAPDGIVGPHGEKEGSYFTIKELWSPVQIEDLALTPKGLSMRVSNRYSFTNLRETRVEWQFVKLPSASNPTGHREVVLSGQLKGPELEAGAEKLWEVPIKLKGRKDFDVAQLSVVDANGQQLWTWSVPNQRATSPPANETTFPPATVEGGADRVSVHVAMFELGFSRSTGRLTDVSKEGRTYPLRNGPQPVAYRREGKKFVPIAPESRLLELKTEGLEPGEIARAKYDGILRQVVWSRVGDAIAVDYEVACECTTTLFGVSFDVPEASVRNKRWVGNGPYRVWQNRLQGGVWDLHEVSYNNAVPGESYQYPEFSGYFSNWQWLALETDSGTITVENASDIPYFGLFRPPGGVRPILELPDVGLSLLSVIPAMGSKFGAPELFGPQSQPRTLRGSHQGRVLLRLQ